MRVLKASTAARSILQVRGLRQREVKSCAQSHTVSTWGSDPDSVGQSPCFPDPLCSYVRTGILSIVLDSEAPPPCLRQGAMPHLVRAPISNSAVKWSPIFSRRPKINHAASFFSNFNRWPRSATWEVLGSESPVSLLNIDWLGVLGSLSTAMSRSNEIMQESGGLLAKPCYSGPVVELLSWAGTIPLHLTCDLVAFNAAKPCPLF